MQHYELAQGIVTAAVSGGLRVGEGGPIVRPWLARAIAKGMTNGLVAGAMEVAYTYTGYETMRLDVWLSDELSPRLRASLGDVPYGASEVFDPEAHLNGLLVLDVTQMATQAIVQAHVPAIGELDSTLALNITESIAGATDLPREKGNLMLERRNLGRELSNLVSDSLDGVLATAGRKTTPRFDERLRQAIAALGNGFTVGDLAHMVGMGDGLECAYHLAIEEALRSFGFQPLEDGEPPAAWFSRGIWSGVLSDRVNGDG